MKTILLLIILLLIPIFSYAENDIDSGLSSGYILGRLDAIDEILQYKRSAEEEAQLLYEKAVLINMAYKPRVGLKTMTECIIKAIELVPDNEDYKDFLREIYNKEWKDKKFSDDDGMRELKNKIETLLLENKALEENNEK